MSKILYSIAEDLNRKLIQAHVANKDNSYFCPFCKQELILRKGIKKRAHFAHKALSPNCSPETALHYIFKIKLFEKIRLAIVKGEFLKIQWQCSNCHEVHSGNLLKKVSQVALEYDLDFCRPDIALLDNENKVIAAIEIIVTHSPEAKVLDFYKENDIVYVSYNLKSDEDCNRLEDDVLKPDNVDLCVNPKCPHCGKRMVKKQLLIIDAKCWKCNSFMKVAALTSRSGYIRLSDFSESDIKTANQKGCFLKPQYSNVVKERYVANTCKKCMKFIGDHYLFGDYVADLELEREAIEAGYFCNRCYFE